MDKVEENLSKRLEELGVDPKEGLEDTTLKPAAEKENSTPAESAVETKEAKAGTEESVEDSTPAKSADESAEDTKPTLSDALRRSATHQGWKTEDIDAFYGSNPELATKTFEKMHQDVNTLSTRYAALGRTIRDADVKKVSAEQTATETAAAKKIDLAALKETHGDDPVVAAMEQLVAQNTELAAKLEQVKVTPVAGTQQQDSTMGKQIDVFFKSLTPYEDFYGGSKDVGDLTQNQLKHQDAVLEMADALAVGYRAQNIPITVEEALELAHLNISEAVREKAVRDEIKSTVKKRNENITLKPSDTKTGTDDSTSAVRSTEKAETTAAAKIKALNLG